MWYCMTFTKGMYSIRCCWIQRYCICVLHITVKYLVWVVSDLKTSIFLLSSCSCLCVIYWSQVTSREWRCSRTSADRRCSNYIWVIKNVIAYQGAAYIGGLAVVIYRIRRPHCVISESGSSGKYSHWLNTPYHSRYTCILSGGTRGVHTT